MKKSVVFFVLFFGILGCCKDRFTQWTIADIDVSIKEINNANPMKGQVFGDSINLVINYIPQFSVNKSNFSNIFVNSAFAASCPRDGEDGMYDSIKSFTVSSDTTFNNFASGESINNIITLGRGISIEDWISNSKEWSFEFISFEKLTITEKPISNIEHRFKVEIELESGSIITGESEQITWN